MNDEDHGSSRNFIAHHAEENEAGSHKVVQQVFVEFTLLSLDDHHFKN